METMIKRCLALLVLVHLCSSCLTLVTALDVITSSNPIKDPEAINSSNGVFRLGFFSPVNSSYRYVGVWYSVGRPENSVIWVANRDNPLKDNSGVVSISEDGNLVVLDGQKEIVWSSNVENRASNVSAQVLDSGNLVLQANNSTNNVSLWESFQDPSNALIPTMKVMTDIRTGEKVQLKSWKNCSDPSDGSFAIGLGTLRIPQIFIWKDSRPYWRSGPWNGQFFVGVQLLTNITFILDGINIVDDKEGSFYVTYVAADKSALSYFLLDSQGNVTRRSWDEGKKDWSIWTSPQNTQCDMYGKCGEFGSCNPETSPICSCLRGFEPNNLKEWNGGNWTNGCMRAKPLQCGNQSGKQDGFLKVKSTKVPDFAEWSSAPQDECKDRCQNNCSCIAYAYDPGIGCMSWSQNLVDIKQFPNGGIDLYIRLAHSELAKKKNISMIIIIAAVIGTIVIAISAFFLWRWRAKHKANEEKSEERRMLSLSNGESHSKALESCTAVEDISEDKLQQLPVYKLEELAIATNNFSLSNKLGQGGFGLVYRGTLKDGQKVAVKRLSQASGQGFDEFMNEVLLISKLQHRNLVKLLGCCVEGEEKMLVYEYMQNRSLDAFIFDPIKQKLLDWQKRFNIIEGISRGLLYLHRDSRLRIIHRDLKASNILLDEEMNPKISDFGMARIFGGNENQANTRRVVGTYGYMAPEYAMQGKFSEKSDVFSYGVLLLQIISGRRNTSFHHNENSLSLLRYAWQLWNEDNILALPDNKMVSDPCHHQEILRCIHVGLLCVQESAKDRPTISSVISMLNSEIIDLPIPKQPAFIEEDASDEEISTQNSRNKYSINDMSVTNVEGR